jgi:cyclophilin family peptidyl-prolyl cis-trans isomerase
MMKYLISTSALLFSIQVVCVASFSPAPRFVLAGHKSLAAAREISHSNEKLTTTSTTCSSSSLLVKTCRPSRRSFLSQAIALPTIALILSPTVNNAAEAELSTSSSDAQITSKIFLQLNGLPTDESNDLNEFSEDIITIGLFGNDAPQATSILKQIVSKDGYSTKCKPKEVRTLQREQLEANKVYNSCMEMQDTKGVTYDLSTVWRVVKNERIDVGAVSGKFVARENPLFTGGNERLKHDVEGVVSVRKGSDGGFGFVIYPGISAKNNADLDEDNIVVGRVIDGMDVVRRLNQIPVIQSAQGLNYKGLGGSTSSKRSAAPSRACRYGSKELYCNEFKPLKKISIQKTGTL